MGLTFMPAGTIPTIGLTALQLFQKSGAPWTSNPSVVVTSGQGGTGYMAVQLAKTLGAANVTTAATGPGIDMVTALGATLSITKRKISSTRSRTTASTSCFLVDMVALSLRQD